MRSRVALGSFVVFGVCTAFACAQTQLLEAPESLQTDAAAPVESGFADGPVIREPELLAKNLPGVLGIAVDETHVYVACYDGKSAFAVPKAGGTPVELGHHTTAVLDVTVDKTRVYWSVASSSNAGGAAGKILSLPTTDLGGAPTTHASGANLTPWSLANDDARIYYGNDAVFALDKVNGTTTQLGGGEISTPVFVTTDSVYWVSRMEGVVRAADKSGGNGRTLASAAAQAITSVVADAESAYFLENDGARAHVYAVPTQGGARRELTSSGQSGFAMTLDAKYIYWTSLAGGVLSRVPKEGGSAELMAVNIVSPELRGGAVTNDSAFVYYATGGGNLFRLRK